MFYIIRSFKGNLYSLCRLAPLLCYLCLFSSSCNWLLWTFNISVCRWCRRLFIILDHCMFISVGGVSGQGGSSLGPSLALNFPGSLNWLVTKKTTVKCEMMIGRREGWLYKVACLIIRVLFGFASDSDTSTQHKYQQIMRWQCCLGLADDNDDDGVGHLAEQCALPVPTLRF